MKDFTSWIVILAVAIVMIGLAGWYYSFRFQDCKMVGHSETYCIMDMFTN